MEVDYCLPSTCWQLLLPSVNLNIKNAYTPSSLFTLYIQYSNSPMSLTSLSVIFMQLQVLGDHHGRHWADNRPLPQGVSFLPCMHHSVSSLPLQLHNHSPARDGKMVWNILQSFRNYIDQNYTEIITYFAPETAICCGLHIRQTEIPTLLHGWVTHTHTRTRTHTHTHTHTFCQNVVPTKFCFSLHFCQKKKKKA
jgi:hypothetical protein